MNVERLVRASNPMIVMNGEKMRGVGVKGAAGGGISDWLQGEDTRYSSDYLYSDAELTRDWDDVADVQSSMVEMEVEAYWMDYTMRVPCEEPLATKSKTLETITSLEQQFEQGIISVEQFEEAKTTLSKQFWGQVLDEQRMQRAYTTKEIQIQVSNSAQFVDSWVRMNVLDVALQTIGVSVECNSGVRVKGGQRHRISVIQIATPTSVLVVRLSQLQPLKFPPLLRKILGDPAVRKVGNQVLKDAVKLAKDWGVRVLGRVDAYQRAAEFGYIDAANKRNKGVASLAKGRSCLHSMYPCRV